MSTATTVAIAAAFVLTVAILAALTAWAIYWLVGRNSHQIRLSDVVYLLNNRTDAHDHPHHHDDSYSLLGHDHDKDYSPVCHDHDDRYVTRAEFTDHTHPQNVTHDELNGRLAWVERTAAWFQLEQFDGEQNLIVRGMLLGSVFGLIVGLILDLVLPHRFFMNEATTTFHVNGQNIVQHLTSSNNMLYIGIPFACAFAGLVLGGFAFWIYQTFRERQIRNENRFEQITTTRVTANDVPARSVPEEN